MWLSEYRLDGLRIDSTIYMRNTKGVDNDPAHDIPDAWYLLQDIVQLAHKINPHAIMIAEDAAATPYITKPRRETGCGFDAQWELGYPHAVRDALALNASHAATLDGIQYELQHEYTGDTFEKIIFSDSHDTAANGSVRLSEAAAPERPASLDARQATLIADAVTLTGPGIPMLLQGAEFMQEGAFNDWQALDWDRAEKHQGIVTAHQHLIQLRGNFYGNTAGLLGQSTALIHRNDDNHVIAFHRWDKGGAGDDVVVIVNFSSNSYDEYRLQVPRAGSWTARFNSSWRGYSADFPETNWTEVHAGDDYMIRIPLAPYAVYIISQ
jgi:1,4-alpha-glucan branching enzyme